MSDRIYFDNNSTTLIVPEVVQAITDCLQQGYLNPASQHGSGRASRRVLEQSREHIAALLGASLQAPDQDQLLFTSGGTESNNLAIRGLVAKPGEILISSIEHPSALAAAEELLSSGYVLRSIPVTSTGHVEVDVVDEMITSDTRLVCVMMGNNEVGSLQPIQSIASICAGHGVPMHCDAVQAVGKMPIDFRQLGVTSMAFSAHKFHGPRGIGGLLVRHGARLRPLLVGGSQQLGLRPGTEPVASVVGMSKALELFAAEQGTTSQRIRNLRDQLQELLTDEPGCVINGAEPRLPQTLNVSFPGIDRQALVMALDFAGIECSTGSACTSGSSEPSHVLVAMGCDSAVVESSIRLSLSSLTTAAEIEAGAERILAVVRQLRAAK